MIFSKNIRCIIIILIIFTLIQACNVYSILSFSNQSQVPVYLKYIQENGKIMEQEISSKEELNMMFDKKWTDKNTRIVTNSIKEITIYTSTDTIYHSLNKDEIYRIFKDNCSTFKDKVTLKIE